jgi:hypothetical protein
LTSYFAPSEWFLLDVEYPAIINCPVSHIASENNEEWFGVGQCMPIPFPWRFIVAADGIPDTDTFFDIEMKKLIGSKAS